MISRAGLPSSGHVDASCSPKHREVGRGGEKRKAEQTKGADSLEGKGPRRKADKGEGALGTRLSYKPSGPDDLCMRWPAELANPAAE